MWIAGRKCVLVGVGVAVVTVAMLLTKVSDARPDKQPEKKTKQAAKEVHQPGYVEAYEQMQLYARIAGFAEEPKVDIGDYVKEGDLLVRLWVPELDADRKQKVALLGLANIQVQQAKLGLQEAKTLAGIAMTQAQKAQEDVKTLQANLDTAKTRYERFKHLLEEKAVSAQFVQEEAARLETTKAALEEAKARLLTATATREGSVSNVERAKLGVQAAEAQQTAAQAEVEGVEVLLDYRDVRAPFHGVVTKRAVNKGTLVGPPSARGEPMFTVTRTSVVRVVVQIPEADSVRIKEGAAATVQFPALKDRQVKGEVTRFAWVLDPHARTMRVEIHLKNPDGKLRPGMSANVTIALSQD